MSGQRPALALGAVSLDSRTSRISEVEVRRREVFPWLQGENVAGLPETFERSLEQRNRGRRLVSRKEIPGFAILLVCLRQSPCGLMVVLAGAQDQLDGASVEVIAAARAKRLRHTPRLIELVCSRLAVAALECVAPRRVARLRCAWPYPQLVVGRRSTVSGSEWRS